MAELYDAEVLLFIFLC